MKKFQRSRSLQRRLAPVKFERGTKQLELGITKKRQMKGREIRPLCDGILNIRGLIDGDKWIFNLGQGVERGCGSVWGCEVL